MLRCRHWGLSIPPGKILGGFIPHPPGSTPMAPPTTTTFPSPFFFFVSFLGKYFLIKLGKIHPLYGPEYMVFKVYNAHDAQFGCI